MAYFFAFIVRSLGTTLLLAAAGFALAQAPVITGLTPLANARAASRTAPVTVSFSQPLTPASAGALKVFSSQRGGLRSRGTTPAVVSGSTLSFAPTAYPWLPGETVSYTVTTGAAGSGGALARPRVGQFTAAVGGTGRGYFNQGTDVLIASNALTSVAAGDLDGDGDLDMLVAARSSSTLLPAMNVGNGTFNAGGIITVGARPLTVALGDLDSDGDLDCVAAAYNFSTDGVVSVRLNNGSGNFSGTQDVMPMAGAGSTGMTNAILGDTDGDGDLDLLMANEAGQLYGCLNNGSGVYGPTSNLGLNIIATSGMALGDVDNDGDLDLMVSARTFATNVLSVEVSLNDGTGTFTQAQSLPAGTNTAPFNGVTSLVTGDVDGDGDLDLLFANGSSAGVAVRLNNGTGTFAGTQLVAMPFDYVTPGTLALGDADGDGDLDLFALSINRSLSFYGAARLRLNDGSGTFSGTRSVGAFLGPTSIALGDVDSDGDLDMMVSDGQTSTVSIRPNDISLATVTGIPGAALTLIPNPAHLAATLTGTAPHAPVQVLDVLGRPVLTATADASGTVRLALPTGLAPGLYLVRSGGQVRRLLVE